MRGAGASAGYDVEMVEPFTASILLKADRHEAQVISIKVWRLVRSDRVSNQMETGAPDGTHTPESRRQLCRRREANTGLHAWQTPRPKIWPT